MKKEITCIVCPIGCKILVEVKDNSAEVCSGNKCKQGLKYAVSEALDPKRVLTSSVLVKGGLWPLVSVKTSMAIPKNKISSVLKEIKKKHVKAPIKSGDVIIKNIANTNIDVIATKTVNKY